MEMSLVSALVIKQSQKSNKSRKINFCLFSFSRLHIGLLSWSAADCHVNLEEELNTITALALEGEEGKHGKHLLLSPATNGR